MLQGGGGGGEAVREGVCTTQLQPPAPGTHTCASSNASPRLERTCGSTICVRCAEVSTGEMRCLQPSAARAEGRHGGKVSWQTLQLRSSAGVRSTLLEPSRFCLPQAASWEACQQRGCHSHLPSTAPAASHPSPQLTLGVYPQRRRQRGLPRRVRDGPQAQLCARRHLLQAGPHVLPCSQA